MALLGGFGNPVVSLGHILFHTKAGFIHFTHLELSFSIAFLRQFHLEIKQLTCRNSYWY